jgi:hypothetical protein
VVENVPVTKDVIVRVCNYENQERTGVRTVYDRKTEAVSRTVRYCEMVPYTETVMVPQGGDCAVSSECDSGGRRRLFGRRY